MNPHASWDEKLAELTAFDVENAAEEARSTWKSGGDLEIIVPRVAQNWGVEEGPVFNEIEKILRRS